MNRGLSGERALFAHRFLIRVGLAIANLFAWIFTYEYVRVLTGAEGIALAVVACFYALSQAVTLLLTPISASHLRGGTRGALLWGGVLACTAFVLLGASLQSGLSFDMLWGIGAFAFFLGAYRALYWVPYELLHAENAKGSRLQAGYDVIIALMPLFAGLTMLSMPFAPLRILAGAAAIITLSLLPALFLKDTYERFSWGYLETFKVLLDRRHRSVALSGMLDGVQGAVLFFVWPIAVFLIVGQSYFMLGLVFSITLLLILAVRGLYHKLLVHGKFEASTSVQATVAVSGWVFRLVAGTPGGIILADAYAYGTQPSRGNTSDPLTFEHGADHGVFIDEFTAIKEMSMAVGRIALVGIVALISISLSSVHAFAAALFFAAISSGAVMFLARNHERSAY